MSPHLEHFTDLYEPVDAHNSKAILPQAMQWSASMLQNS